MQEREQFEFSERESRTRHGDRLCVEMFDDLLARVKEYAQQRRIEEVTKKAKGDPMDISQASHVQDMHWEHAGESHHDECQWNHLDALGKGKGGKGKGGCGKATGKSFARQCYTCGESGHLSYECPKGKSKGKGRTLTCWNCGNAGHPHWLCPEKEERAKTNTGARGTPKEPTRSSRNGGLGTKTEETKSRSRKLERQS